MKEVDIRECWRSIDCDKFCGYYFKHFGCTLKTYIIFIRQVLLENGVIHTECKYGGPLGRIGPSCVKSRLVSSQCVLFWQCVSRNLQTSSVSIVIFAMPTHCCVPGCNQKGVKSSTGEKVSFFEFPKQSLLRKSWIHVIRRDKGKNWQITWGMKVCSLYFRWDLRKSLAGRTYLVDGCVPSRFAWSIPSPRKRKAPTERLPLPIPLSSQKHLFTSNTSSEINIASSAVESSNEIFPSTSGVNETNKPDISVESNVEMDQGKKVKDLEARLL